MKGNVSSFTVRNILIEVRTCIRFTNPCIRMID